MRKASEKTSAPRAGQPRVPRRRRGRERVASLLEGASAAFLANGYDGATMTDIAARAGAAIGTLYLFFPSKEAIARTLLQSLGKALSARLEALRPQTAGKSAADIADALFRELSHFLNENPVYSALIDLPGDEGWRRDIRAQRRRQIAALFAEAAPPLPPAQRQRLAVIVPNLMRISIQPTGEGGPSREAIAEELRLMLRKRLEGAD
jgi:AcrR family transcriptional regulator